MQSFGRLSAPALVTIPLLPPQPYQPVAASPHATSFVCAYALMFTNPVLQRCCLAGLHDEPQAGHFFFEPKGNDPGERGHHEHKEDIKVGYNLKRKVVLMVIWALSPLVLWLDPLCSACIQNSPAGTSCSTSPGLARRGLADCCSAQSTCSSSRMCRRPGVGDQDASPDPCPASTL